MGENISLHIIRVLLLTLAVFSAHITNGEAKDDAKIVGGVEATPNEFPWLVNLRRNGQVFCSGAIINSSLVLTAAHCVVGLKSSDQINIVAGDHRLNVEESTEQMKRATQYVYHGKYSDKGTIVNDIALLKVETPFVFDKYVQPIALPTTQIESGDVIVAGWGSLRETPTALSNVLMKVELDIVSLNQCKSSYAPGKIDILDTMLCASRLGKDSCQGDSGGPLLCRSNPANANTTYVCGIVSFGNGCARVGFPGVYTKVSAFTAWIEQNSAASTFHSISILILASFLFTAKYYL